MFILGDIPQVAAARGGKCHTFSEGKKLIHELPPKSIVARTPNIKSTNDNCHLENIY